MAVGVEDDGWPPMSVSSGEDIVAAKVWVSKEWLRDLDADERRLRCLTEWPKSGGWRAER